MEREGSRCPPGWKLQIVSPFGNLSGRHGGGANCLFIDGHVRRLRREQAYTPEMFGLAPHQFGL